MEITWLNLFIFSLASFRLTRLFVYDHITGFIRNWFLKEVEEVQPNGEITSYYLTKPGAINQFFGKLLSCYWCTGMWCAISIILTYALIPQYAYPLIIIFAVAGLGSILESLIQKIID